MKTSEKVHHQPPDWSRLWPAPAKINRFLHIVGQRDNGYHELQSVFQLLDFGDELIFQARKDAHIILHHDITGLSAEKNLVYQAATLLRNKAGLKSGLNIELKKNIPIGAGLGGGSSDAATTLLALNYLWGLNYAKETLAALGEQLGADIPFFIHGQNAFVEGIGEKITPIQIDLPIILLQIPACVISTENIFKDPALNRNSRRITLESMLDNCHKDNNIIELAEYGHNDCEKVVIEKYSQVNAAFAWISTLKSARLTGTGSCVFSMFDNSREAGKIALRCPDSIRCLVTKSLQQSPILGMLRQ